MAAVAVPIAPAAAAPVDLPTPEQEWLPVAAEAALAKDVVATGAVNVQELSKEDWEQLPSWVSLKPLERRRLLFFVRPTWG